MTIAESSAAVERFIARAERLGVRVHRVQSDAAAVADAVAAIVRADGSRSALVADDLGPERDAVAARLTADGVQLLAGETPEAAEPAEVGITRATFAIAETGSLGVLGNALQPRVATMLPPVHVALVDRSRLYPSLDEAGAHLERAMAPGGDEAVRYASFVTGPSRTADVEKTLAVGVHGPRLLHIVLIDDVA